MTSSSTHGRSTTSTAVVEASAMRKPKTLRVYIYICGISEVQFVAYTPRGSIETWNTWKVPGTGNIHTAVYQCKVVRTEARNTASEYRTYEYRNKSTITASVSGFDTAHTYCYTATTACSSRSIAVCMSSIEPWNTGSNRRFISTLIHALLLYCEYSYAVLVRQQYSSIAAVEQRNTKKYSGVSRARTYLAQAYMNSRSTIAGIQRWNSDTVNTILI